MQGDGAKTQAAVRRNRSKNTGPLSLNVPWSVNADTEEDEEGKPGDQEAHTDGLEEKDDAESMPYCIMPYVERLLQVCHPFSINLWVFLQTCIMYSPAALCIRLALPIC